MQRQCVDETYIALTWGAMLHPVLVPSITPASALMLWCLVARLALPVVLVWERG